MLIRNLKKSPNIKKPYTPYDVTPFAEGLSKVWAATSESLGCAAAAEQADTSLGQKSGVGTLCQFCHVPTESALTCLSTLF